jgi:hypothetical protein
VRDDSDAQPYRQFDGNANSQRHTYSHNHRYSLADAGTNTKVYSNTKIPTQSDAAPDAIAVKELLTLTTDFRLLSISMVTNAATQNLA